MQGYRLQSEVALGQYEAILELGLRVYVGDLLAKEEGKPHKEVAIGGLLIL